MKNDAAIEILEALKAGRDPKTDVLLDPESVLRRRPVLEALSLAILALKLQGVKTIKILPRKNSERDIDTLKVKTWNSVAEAARKECGITITGAFAGGPDRFRAAGWFYVGQQDVLCPDCQFEGLHGFRKPYVSGERTFHYWALVCNRCQHALEPKDLPEETRKLLHAESKLRPGPRNPEDNA